MEVKASALGFWVANTTTYIAIYDTVTTTVTEKRC